MKNGATIYLEASWALNVLKSMEASTTLCGTKAGAEIHHGGSYPQDELIYNTVEHNQLMEKTISPAGVVDFFEGGAAAEAVRSRRLPRVEDPPHCHPGQRRHPPGPLRRHG